MNSSWILQICGPSWMARIQFYNIVYNVKLDYAYKLFLFI